LTHVKIIYEDRDVIVIDKPAGVIVHPVKSADEPSLLDEFRDKIDPRGFPALRPGVVHRLDADTSGVLILAKNSNSAVLLSAQFKNRTVKKSYLALVHGKLEPAEGMIDLPVGRTARGGNRMSVYGGRGKDSRTSYKVIATAGSLSLLRLGLHTGRTHQIRAHLLAIGFPILGDKTYGSPSRDKRAGITLNRQFLHASTLELTLPSGQNTKFASPLPKELHSILTKVGLYLPGEK